MTVLESRVVCARCHCMLAADNTNDQCGPCLKTTAKARVLGLGDAAGSGFDPGVPLSSIGIESYAEHLGVSVSAAISQAFTARKLSETLRHAEPLLIQLVSLRALGHVAAAEELGVTRWTIQSWRNELGLRSPRALRPKR